MVNAVTVHIGGPLGCQANVKYAPFPTKQRVLIMIYSHTLFSLKKLYELCSITICVNTDNKGVYGAEVFWKKRFALERSPWLHPQVLEVTIDTNETINSAIFARFLR